MLRNTFHAEGDAPAMTPREQELYADEAYTANVKRCFFRDGKLKSIPAQLKKKKVVYALLAELFTPGRDYAEREVNELLAPIYPDFCTLRRGLVDDGLLTREGGVYRRA